MNLKEAIKKIVNSKKSAPDVLKEITEQKVKAAKNKSFGLYNDLSKIEHSLYRFNSLTDSGINNSADAEGKNLLHLAENTDSGNIVLKGGISNTKYIWKTEPNACEKCRELDGKEFDTKDEIPDKPHPNCKCQVTQVNSDEPCDCSEFFDELDNISENIDAARQDVDGVVTFIKDALTIYSTNPLANLAYSIMNQIDIAMEAYHDFQKNKAEMIAYKGYDKYHHAKANCEATQRGLTGEAMAYTLSYGKEVYDIIKKVIFDGMEFEKAWTDSMQDIEADKFGIKKGRGGNPCSESVKNVGDIFNLQR